MDHFYCSTPLFCHWEELVEKDYVRIRSHMTNGEYHLGGREEAGPGVEEEGLEVFNKRWPLPLSPREERRGKVGADGGLWV